MPKLSAYYHPFICLPPLLTVSGNRKITQKVRIKHITPACQAVSSEWGGKKSMADQVLSLDSNSKTWQ